MILVTGATGFIGSHLVAELEKQSLKYKGVVRSKHKNKGNGCYISIGELTTDTDWSDALDGVTSIIHLAGIAHRKDASNSSYIDVNVQSSLSLVRCASKAGVKRIVFVSSIGVNGNISSKGVFSPIGTPSPSSSYTWSKYVAEVGIQELCSALDVECVIVRPTLVYGPRAPGNFGTLCRAVQVCPVMPFGLSNNKRDFIAVQNLVDLLIACSRHPNAPGHCFLASDGEAVSTRQFVDAIAKGLNKNVFQIPLPPVLAKITALAIGKRQLYEQLFGDLQVDSSNARELLSWKAPYTMEQAMSLLVES